MTAASNSDARKRNAAQVDPVEVVRTAIFELAYLPHMWSQMSPSTQHDYTRSAVAAVDALRAEGLLS